MQLYREEKLYSSRLVEDCFSNFVNKHPAIGDEHPPKAYGLMGISYFHRLNPYEELVHAISTRERMNTSTQDILQKYQETCGRFSVALWIPHYLVS